MKKFKDILFILLVMFLSVSVVRAETESFVTCGNSGELPSGLPGTIRFIIELIQFIVPIAIVIIGSTDFLKAMFNGDSAGMKKHYSKFVKRLIAGSAVFFLVILVKLLINSLTVNNDGLGECLACFTTNDASCHYDSKEVEEVTVENDPKKAEREKKREEQRKKNEEKSNAIKERDKVLDDNGSRPGSGGKGSKNIIVGDSRTVGLCVYKGGDYNVCPNSNGRNPIFGGDYYVAQSAMGYSWFNSTAIGKVDSILSSNSGTKFNILINLGVNDLFSIQSYISKVNELARGKWKNHKIVYVSVNPCNGSYSHMNSKIIDFNTKIKNNIDSSIGYCDTYNEVINTFKTVDGLHYDKKTSLDIYNVMIKCLG